LAQLTALLGKRIIWGPGKIKRESFLGEGILKTKEGGGKSFHKN